MSHFCLVTQRLGAYVPDGNDLDRYPDYKNLSGRVTFTPLITSGDSFKIRDEEGVRTVPITAITAQIVDGEIVHEGEKGVYLFAAGENSNPEEVYYRVSYSGLVAEGQAFTLRDARIKAIPGGTIDLGEMTPVAGTPAAGVVQGPVGPAGPEGPRGEIGIQGPQGVSVSSVGVSGDGEDAVFRMTDGKTFRVPLKAGPKGDPGEVTQAQLEEAIESSKSQPIRDSGWLEFQIQNANYDATVRLRRVGSSVHVSIAISNSQVPENTTIALYSPEFPSYMLPYRTGYFSAVRVLGQSFSVGVAISLPQGTYGIVSDGSDRYFADFSYITEEPWPEEDSGGIWGQYEGPDREATSQVLRSLPVQSGAAFWKIWTEKPESQRLSFTNSALKTGLGNMVMCSRVEIAPDETHSSLLRGVFEGYEKDYQSQEYLEFTSKLQQYSASYEEGGE